jgi:hypothetical protein
MGQDQGRQILRDETTVKMEEAKGIIRLNILQYMRQPTTHQLHACVIRLIPKFAKAMLIYTYFEGPYHHD